MQRDLYRHERKKSERAGPASSNQQSDHYAITSVNDLDIYHVNLSPETFRFAEELGRQRIARAEKKKYKDKWGKPSPISHEIGAVCETALRFVLGEDPFTVPDLDGGGPDIQPNIQCRGTDHLPAQVWVRPGDDPGLIVIGSRWYRKPRKGYVVVSVWGWILAEWVQRSPDFAQANPGDRVPGWPVHWSRLNNLTPIREGHLQYLKVKDE